MLSGNQRQAEEQPMVTILRTRARRLILTGILAAGLGAGAASAAEAATTGQASHPVTTTSAQAPLPGT
jgi:hypothetical protein